MSDELIVSPRSKDRHQNPRDAIEAPQGSRLYKAPRNLNGLMRASLHQVRQIEQLKRAAIAAIPNTYSSGLARDVWWRTPPTPLDRVSENPDFHVVAIGDTLLAGAGWTRCSTTQHGVIHSVLVNPAVAGCGLGELCLQCIEKEAKNSMLDALYVHAAPNAVGFFQSAGYQVVDVGEQQLFENITAICLTMAKPLQCVSAET